MSDRGEAVRPDPASLSGSALAYMDFVKGEAPRTLEPGFSHADWDDLARLVDTASFTRVAGHGEAMDWTETVDLMHRSVGGTKTYVLRGASEVGNRVFLELEETVSHEGGPMVFDSVYIFTFNTAGKVTKLEFFMH